MCAVAADGEGARGLGQHYGQTLWLLTVVWRRGVVGWARLSVLKTACRLKVAMKVNLDFVPWFAGSFLERHATTRAT